MLGARLKQWNLLQKDIKICVFRNSHTNLASFYQVEGGICFCADVDGLMHELDRTWEAFVWLSRTFLVLKEQ